MRPRGRTGAGASELMDMSGMWSAHLQVRPTINALTKVLARLAFRDRSKETVGCYGALVGSALSIRAEYMRSGLGGFSLG